MKIKDTQLKQKLLTTLLFGATVLSVHTAEASRPLWTITASTPTTVTIPQGASTTVIYTVTNTSYKTRTLMWLPIAGVTQAIGSGLCASAQSLAPNASCTLQLTISSAAGAINGGPQVCQQGPDGQPSPLQCYQPIASQSLQVSTVPAVSLGDSYGGGKVACLGSGPNQLLIAANTDISSAIRWGGAGTAIGPSAQSTTDGASNTQAIVNTLGANGGTAYAAQLCANYEIDSQANTPCLTGNTCYNDWFLPASPAVSGIPTSATSQVDCLWLNRTQIGGFAINGYWSSTESSLSPSFSVWFQSFVSGIRSTVLKQDTLQVRCVRAFAP